MKRLLSTFCLLVGASVATWAGVVTNATGTNLLGPNAALQNFDSTATFPLGSFTSLSQFTLTSNSVSTNVNISVAGGSGTRNTGNTAQITNVSGTVYGTSSTPGVGSLSGSYINTLSGPVFQSGSFARTLTITFSTAVNEFLIDYFDNNGNLASNFMTINGLSTQYNLANTTCNPTVANNCTGTGRQIGFVADSSVPSISSVTFTFLGQDGFSSYGGDMVLFDNLRVFAAASNNSSGGNNGGGEIPEPSTYALLGAGLIALAYARRKN